MKVALLGAGHWHAPMHADAARFAGATLCAVWDPDATAARALADRFDAPAIPSLDQVLATRPDICVTMGHPAEVPALARALIDAGMPMILEKPAAPETRILREIEARAQAQGVFVAVPLANRLSPAMRGLARSPEDAGGGDDAAPRVAHASFRIVNGPPERYRDDGVPWVLDPAAAGGGALRNLGLHGIDCALCLADGPVRVTSAQIARRLHPDEMVEDHALVTLTDAAGALFVVEAGYTTPAMQAGGDLEWRVATKGAYLVDRGDSAQWIGPRGLRSLPALPPDERYRAFMTDTLARLADGRPPLVGLSDYVAAMAVIDQAYALAAE